MSEEKERPAEKWGEEFNFRKGDDFYAMLWANLKSQHDDYRERMGAQQSRSQAQFEQLTQAHNDLVVKLNDQYVKHTAELNSAHTTHVNNCNKATIQAFLNNAENMRHGFNLMTNLDVPEAVAMGEILDQPQKSAIEALVLETLANAIKPKA